MTESPAVLLAALISRTSELSGTSVAAAAAAAAASCYAFIRETISAAAAR